jgi:hypothetical protein
MPSIAEAVDLPFEEAQEFFRQKIRMPSDNWTDVWKEAHSRAVMVAGAASDSLLRDFQQAIQKALDHGTTLGEFRKDFDSIVKTHGWQHTGAPGWRAQIIYETNLATAYSAGRYVQMTEPDTLRHFPFWEYRHSGSSHPRLMHLGWNGLTLRADDPWWDSHYPPNGWHCGCRVSPVSEGGLRRMGKTGPDPAPPVVTKPWSNPHTGEVHQVPAGIDPGFDYNMGKAWKEGRAAQAPVRAPRLRPVGAPVPQPSDKQIDALRKFVEKPEGSHPLGELHEMLRGPLDGATEAVLPADAVAPGKRRGVTETDMLLLPLLIGDPEIAAATATGVLTAVTSGGGMIAGMLFPDGAAARLTALRRLSPKALERLLERAVPIIGGK